MSITPANAEFDDDEKPKLTLGWKEKVERATDQRSRERQEQRAREIGAAQAEYDEQLRLSKATAAAKEREMLAEQKRLRDIEEHQRRVREGKQQRAAVSPRNVTIPETYGRRLMYGAIKGKRAMYLYHDEYDQANLEAYLHDSEFEAVFGMTKTQFYSLPAHKRIEHLKRVDLF